MIKKCPKCGSDNYHTELTSLSECPKCGVIYSKAKPPIKPSEKQSHETYKTKSNLDSKIHNWYNNQTGVSKVFYICMIFLGLVILIAPFLPDMPVDKTPTRSNTGSIPYKGDEALVRCRYYIKSRLTSPSSASFSSLFDSTITSLGPGKYRVSGYVDAQNAFGAKIRNNYTCVVRREGGEWTLESLSLY